MSEHAVSGDLVARIRDEILAGGYVPEQRLVEADLSEKFGEIYGLK